jgi:hypothetical protein
MQSPNPPDHLHFSSSPPSKRRRVQAVEPAAGRFHNGNGMDEYDSRGKSQPSVPNLAAEQVAHEEEQIDEFVVPVDTMAALQLLQSEFPCFPPVSLLAPPVLLQPTNNNPRPHLPRHPRLTPHILPPLLQDKPAPPPFALKSQLYTVIQDATDLDQELDELRCAAVLAWLPATEQASP